LLSVRPALIPRDTILAHVQGSYNAIWIRGVHGEDTFYYGRGAGPTPTGVAVVSDLMRVAREIVNGSPERVSPFAHPALEKYAPAPIEHQVRAYYLRFRVRDQPGIIATLASILAEAGISLEGQNLADESLSTHPDWPIGNRRQLRHRLSLNGDRDPLSIGDPVQQSPRLIGKLPRSNLSHATNVAKMLHEPIAD
jgi:homoserine dehydrogenase